MNFNQPYNRQKYLCFFRDELLPEDFETCDEKIEVDFQSKFIKYINKIGESPSLEVNVYEITHKSENDPRISLSRESFRLLSQYGIKRALVLFVPENQTINYRLSLITIDLKWDEGTQVKKEYSNPHRYSFLLGPDSKIHTPEYYLLKKGRVKDFEDLKNRFSIEVVNKDFYIEIACLFTELAGGERTVGRKKIKEDGCLSLPYTSDDTIKKEFAVRLIGRLIFCWFLKKKNSNSGKPLIPEELLSTQSVKQNQNFYHTILEPLFFGTLNTPIEDRNELYKDTPWDQIPFLNGGLFEPGIHDYYDIDEGLGISKNINTLKVPDSWLTELFGIFETYNFTIDENTSVDIELSIEPEMLGRIFENLLAEINPVTGETARKSTGSYYTPRPIVDFMVNESLKQYMLTKTDIEEEKISSLLAYEEEKVELSDDEQDVIIDALDSIKIIDPACGSGAFPMGILQKMLLILQKIDPESKEWANKKIARIDNYISKNEFQKKVEEGNWDYLHKLGIIQNSIYGVDIQSIAVDISKLRFFLSLIVDENVDDSQKNRGIKPLPNLEFKFVCANSLIGLPEVFSKKSNNHSHPKIFEKVSDIEKLRKFREQYFGAYGDDKKEIEKKFQELQKEMFLSSLSWIQWGGADSQTVKLSQWNPFSGEQCEWFDPDWMFGIKDGFDVVIANPPYIDSEKMVNIGLGDQRIYISNNYRLAKGNWDIYIAFFEKGLRLLNNDAFLVFITPDKWLSKPFGRELRVQFLKHMFSIVKCGREIFESSKIDAIITVISKKETKNLNILEYKEDLFEYKKNVSKSILDFPYNLDFLFSKYLDLLMKIESSSSRLKELGICENACATSDAYKLKDLIKDAIHYDYDRENFLKVLNTGTIGKYFAKWGHNEMTYLGKKYLCPIVDKNKFIRMFNNTYVMRALSKKIIIKGLTLFEGCIDLFGVFIPGKSTLLVKTSTDEKLKLLLLFINCKLTTFYLREKYQSYSYNQGVNFTKDMVNNLPMPNIPVDRKNLLNSFVNKILSITQTRDYSENFTKQKIVKELEEQIDQIIYQLYKLKDEEIEIVENFHKK